MERFAVHITSLASIRPPFAPLHYSSSSSHLHEHVASRPLLLFIPSSLITRLISGSRGSRWNQMARERDGEQEHEERREGEREQEGELIRKIYDHTNDCLTFLTQSIKSGRSGCEPLPLLSLSLFRSQDFRLALHARGAVTHSPCRQERRRRRRRERSKRGAEQEREEGKQTREGVATASGSQEPGSSLRMRVPD